MLLVAKARLDVSDEPQALGRLYRGRGVNVRYGLGLTVAAVALGVIKRCRAVAIAHKVQAANPLHIKDGVLARFFKRCPRAEVRR